MSALRGIALVSIFRVDPNEQKRQRESRLKLITCEVFLARPTAYARLYEQG